MPFHLLFNTVNYVTLYEYSILTLSFFYIYKIYNFIYYCIFIVIVRKQLFHSVNAVPRCT